MRDWRNACASAKTRQFKRRREATQRARLRGQRNSRRGQPAGFKWDMVIIPVGTPHGFSDVQEAITYTIVRIDPARVLALK
jgi:hypothetical protein